MLHQLINIYSSSDIALSADKQSSSSNMCYQLVQHLNHTIFVSADKTIFIIQGRATNPCAASFRGRRPTNATCCNPAGAPMAPGRRPRSDCGLAARPGRGSQSQSHPLAGWSPVCGPDSHACSSRCGTCGQARLGGRREGVGVAMRATACDRTAGNQGEALGPVRGS